MPETTRLEYKERLDPTDQRDRLVLVKEIVAMANSEGGTIVVGIRDDGAISGVGLDDLKKWDGARIGDLLDGFLNPDQLEIGIEFNSEGCPDGRSLVHVMVPRTSAPPLVLSKDGNYTGGTSPLFRKGSVLVRRNTKVEAAKRSDFLHWREELRNRILQQFQMVVEAPETAHLRVVGEEEVRDEPQYLLSRGADLFRKRKEKLLDGDDLLFLFENRSSIDLDSADVADLLIQSSLRRRATLYFWLALLQPQTHRIEKILDDALDMSDRDKSDMAGAIPIVASLYLTEDQYAHLILRMSDSAYAHMRAAAREYPTMADAAAERKRRRRASINSMPVAEFGEEELIRAADKLAASKPSGRISRPMSALGLEYLARKLDIE